MSEHFDAIVVGTGQAGPSLAARLAQAGQSVAVIERSAVGGTCVNWGCTPTKTLVASARVAHLARRAADFGVAIDGGVRVDMQEVKERMWKVALGSRHGLRDWLAGLEGVELIEGDARLAAGHEVRVAGRTLAAERVFLNVGARAKVPPIPGLEDVSYLDNARLLESTELPEHLVVLGGSYVGLEFAQMYRRFGSRVTVIERGERLIGQEDSDISEAVRQILTGEGIDVRLGAEITRVRPHGAGVEVQIEGGHAEPVAGSHLLLALGRTPNTDELGLEDAGVETDERGYISVDDRLETSARGIWALGDCNGRGAFTHTAYNDFEIVAGNLLDGDTRRVTDRIPCYALYTDPPLGRVGMNAEQARASGANVLVGRLPMSSVARAKERSETAGLLEVLVDGDSERILGASLLGIGADEVVHTLIDLMQTGASYKTLARAVHIHPTVAEMLPSMMQSLEPLG